MVGTILVAPSIASQGGYAFLVLQSPGSITVSDPGIEPLVQLTEN